MTRKRVLIVTSGGRRYGKSLYAAAFAAAHLKAGGRVVLGTRNIDGGITVEPIVGVPGFDDGRQITDQCRGE